MDALWLQLKKVLSLSSNCWHPVIVYNLSLYIGVLLVTICRFPSFISVLRWWTCHMSAMFITRVCICHFCIFFAQPRVSYVHIYFGFIPSAVWRFPAVICSHLCGISCRFGSEWCGTATTTDPEGTEWEGLFTPLICCSSNLSFRCLLSLRLMPIIPWVLLGRFSFSELTLSQIFSYVGSLLVLPFCVQVLMWLLFSPNWGLIWCLFVAHARCALSSCSLHCFSRGWFMYSTSALLTIQSIWWTYSFRYSTESHAVPPVSLHDGERASFPGFVSPTDMINSKSVVSIKCCDYRIVIGY